MSVVILGRFTAEQQEQMRMAVARAGVAPRFCADGPSARRVVGEGTPPSLIVVDAVMNELEGFLTWVRSHARLMGTMILAVVPVANEHAFIEAHMLGADDVVVHGDWGALTKRVGALASFDPASRPPTTMGRAVLAHPIEERRRLVGRVLRLAGFDVAFAATADELATIARSESPPGIVVTSDALTHAASLPDLPCVVLSPHAESVETRERSMTIAEYAPPDNLLFALNELLRPRAADLRASARILHAGLCAYRPAGELMPSFALTYNVSREGLYVRTLDALEQGTDVWLELRPPRADRAVHLRGKVAWARKPGKGPGGAVPPGFGVRLVEEACPTIDLAEYQAGYARLLEQQRMAA